MQQLTIKSSVRSLLTTVVLASALVARAAADPPVHGLPFVRSYSLGDIGTVPRGSKLGFDRFGRITVIHEAVYSVLNDQVWLNLAEPGGMNRIPMLNVVQGADGRSYYGARMSWGYAEFGKDGRLHPVPLVSANPPHWVHTAVFRDLLGTRSGMYFVSWNGVVYWDFARRRSFLFETPGLSRAFRVGDRVFLSCYGAPLRYIDAGNATLQPVPGAPLGSRVVEVATPLDDTQSLIGFDGNQLAVFDGRALTPWPVAKNVISGQVSVLHALVDGKVAVGVTEQGLLLFSRDGKLMLALTMPRYRNIAALANREPGVLWVGTEETVDKVLYGSPLTAFGPTLGLPVNWPIIARWNGRIYVASNGHLYEALSEAPGEPTRFRLCRFQLPGGTYAMDAWGENMLVGNPAGLFEVGRDFSYRPVPTVGDLVYVAMTDADHCFEIGRSGITQLEHQGDHWVEPVPRIQGVQNPAIVHRIGHSVWIEMGGDGVARLSRAGERLQLDVVRNETWTKNSWVNIGAIGDVAVLSSLGEEPRRFFDEKTGRWCEAPQWEHLLNRSPSWIARVAQDNRGVIWATHNEGLVRFQPRGSGYVMDAKSFDLVNDLYPVVHILPEGDVWISTERSLYRIERSWDSSLPKPSHPVLVSLVDLNCNEELAAARWATGAGLRLPYAQNSLRFRIFSGSDAWRRSPVYEYRLKERDPWTPVDGSTVGLRDLREGDYNLQVRMATMRGTSPVTSMLAFEIRPPWFRSWPAYVGFGTVALFLLLGFVRWANYLERRRNRMLEQVVHERTRQLERAMARLGEESRNAATLAERDRMAGEIHDSVQQGLTGAILQLDTTLKSPAVHLDLRSRLNVVRNMVAYARQEVEHAVWDMESPLLDRSELGDALRNLVAFVNSDGVNVEVAVSGREEPLGRTMSHHLLRIAQEATTNAFRHARARRITIRLDYGCDTVSLEIVDDGAGFVLDDVLQARSGHLGLRGIKARVKKLRGKIAIDSVVGEGTSIRIAVPKTIAE
ncbi:MAG TPA: sensor histidine kinase [Opitutus sp.]|nr:sensor histidine kinase [Opitutus sp.]